MYKKYSLSKEIEDIEENYMEILELKNNVNKRLSEWAQQQSVGDRGK